MPVTQVNRKRDAYYLHAGKTKTSKPRYWFSTKADGDLVNAFPEGYEVYENPDAQVFLRKIVPQLVTPDEIAVVKQGLDRYAPGQNCLVDVLGKRDCHPPCRASHSRPEAFRDLIDRIADLQPTLHEKHAIHAGRQERT